MNSPIVSPIYYLHSSIHPHNVLSFPPSFHVPSSMHTIFFPACETKTLKVSSSLFSQPSFLSFPCTLHVSTLSSPKKHAIIKNSLSLSTVLSLSPSLSHSPLLLFTCTLSLSTHLSPSSYASTSRVSIQIPVSCNGTGDAIGLWSVECVGGPPAGDSLFLLSFFQKVKSVPT